jgi:hypothetical protein
VQKILKLVLTSMSELGKADKIAKKILEMNPEFDFESIWE